MAQAELIDLGNGCAELVWPDDGVHGADQTQDAHAKAGAHDLTAAAAAAFEQGFRRVQVRVPVPAAGVRRLVSAGFRHEGVLRGAAGDGADVMLFGRLADDPEPNTLAGWTALMDSVMPTKRLIAHILFRDTGGRVMLVRTSFKNDLELPGGIAEPGETPAGAAVRELAEELGVQWPASRLERLHAVDWLPPWQGWGDAVEFVFDGGVHEPGDLERFTPDGHEIVGVDWYAPDQVAGLVSPLNQRRLSLLVAEPDRCHVLADGAPL